MIPGPRQHVTRVRHPQRGEGLAVRDNGPSFFLPDGGDPVAMGVGLGGATVGPPPRSWMTLVDPVHGRVEADQMPRRESDPPREFHKRAWSPLLGAGWLVNGEEWVFRFEPDAGTVITFKVHGMAIGTPDYADRSARSRASKCLPMTDEECQWTTYRTKDAGTLGFRAAPPPEMPNPNRNPVPPKANAKVAAKAKPAAVPPPADAGPRLPGTG